MVLVVGECPVCLDSLSRLPNDLKTLLVCSCELAQREKEKQRGETSEEKTNSSVWSDICCVPC